MKPVFFLLLLVLAGCQTSGSAPKCKGPAFALNPLQWQPTAKDIKARPAPAIRR